MKIDRLVSIIMIMLEREKVTADELARIFEVSPRTIYRDLDAINQAGIPIISISGPGNGVSIMDTYKVEKRLFSTADITTLLMALGSVQTNFPGVNLVNTLAKVKGMIPEQERSALELQAGQIKIDMEPWLHAEEIQHTLEQVKTAIEQQFLIQFDYQDRKNHHSIRILEPYRLLLKSESWYLQGFCLEREDFRTFKLVRMDNINTLEQVFQMRDFPIEELDSPRFHDIKLYQVKLRIKERIRDDIISRFGKACLEEESPGIFIATIHMPADELAYRYLIGFGNYCECLEPGFVRTEMKLLAESIYKLYEEEDR